MRYISYQEVEEVRILDKVTDALVEIELVCVVSSAPTCLSEEGWGPEFEVESVTFVSDQFRGLDVLKTVGEVIFDSLIDNAIDEAANTGEF